MKDKYVLITPVKDEYENFQKTIKSILNQEIKPSKWVIINDGSTDGTRELIDDLCKINNWVVPVHNPPEYKRKPGGEFVLKKGFDIININEYDFIAKMDGDLSFGQNFFKDLFLEFDRDPKLGIASGSCFIKENGKLIEETKARVHTRGPMKVYRTQCYIDIGGIEPLLGWDTIDEVRAHQRGWTTRTIPELEIIHLRPTQSASGRINGLRNMAKASYYIGYHPLFLIARGIKYMKDKPYIIGGLAMITEYFMNYLERKPQISDQDLKDYVRKEQIKKLLGKETTWS
jgi:poly-beta-1,6-N-acetyl-D-glucosamine synthase